MLAALSIDLDGLEHYHRIHGLAEPPAGDDPVYRKATERFGDLCARLGIRGTVFCVGRNVVSDDRAAAAVRRLAEAGHEIANHTFSHDYRLTRRSPDAIAGEVREGAKAIERVAGARPVGFRAPGYVVTAPVLSVLATDGYRYDSSVFPAPPYYVAKAGVLAALRIARRPSAAILDHPRALLAPRSPYRPSASDPYRRGTLRLLELPITTGLLGFPLIGTFVATLPPLAVSAALVGTRRLPLLNLELHGVDLLDATDASPGLAARQRDLRVPASRKISRIEEFVRGVPDRTWSTLVAASERVELSIASAAPRA